LTVKIIKIKINKILFSCMAMETLEHVFTEHSKGYLNITEYI
jgi:hypothetical protein